MKHIATKYYLYGFLDLVITVATYGFTCPALISAPDTALNIVGVSLALLLPLGLYWLNRTVIKEIRDLYRSPSLAK